MSPDEPHAGPPDPEQDPDAALQVLATGDGSSGRSRRRLAGRRWKGCGKPGAPPVSGWDWQRSP